MSLETAIRTEPAKRLTAPQELALTRAAFARDPASRMFRARLAALQNQTDAFPETIALLDGAEDLAFGEAMMLAQALLATETPADTGRAGDAAQNALALADGDRQRAAALANLGKVQIRLNDRRAHGTLSDALHLDPHNKDACKRLAALYLQENAPRSVVTMVEALSAKGVNHARLFAAHALALARLGEIEAARAVVGAERFRFREMFAPPAGWSGIEDFNAALSSELLSHPGLRYERYGSASVQTWRIDSLAMRPNSLVSALIEKILGLCDRYIREIAGADHPWVRGRPVACTLRAWSVITDARGFESWHVHQFGWLSGVYYVSIPEGVADGSGEGRCIAFGLPEDLAGPSAAHSFGAELIRPQSGMAMLFPSHAYHRTFPHKSSERRICVAFDIRPD